MDAAFRTSTLSFFDHALALGRTLQSHGQGPQASRILNRLAGNRLAPANAGAEARSQLAENLIQEGEYRQARRHLTILLTHEPRNASYHFRLAQAIAFDDRADHRRALRHLQSAVKLAPDNAEYVCEFALLALELGKVQAGLRALKKAVKLAPDDPAILEKAMDGLVYENRFEEARGLLRAARFRHPNDPRFTKLWNDLHFQEILAEQETGRVRFGLNDSRPALLPFNPAKPKTGYRQDAPSRLGSSHLRLVTEKKQIR